MLRAAGSSSEDLVCPVFCFPGALRGQAPWRGEEGGRAPQLPLRSASLLASLSFSSQGPSKPMASQAQAPPRAGYSSWTWKAVQTLLEAPNKGTP